MVAISPGMHRMIVNQLDSLKRMEKPTFQQSQNQEQELQVYENGIKLFVSMQLSTLRHIPKELLRSGNTCMLCTQLPLLTSGTTCRIMTTFRQLMASYPE